MAKELDKSLFVAQELRLNHYSFADLEARKVDYDVSHRYIMLRYNFRESGHKEYVHIYTSNDYQRMLIELHKVYIWENYINKTKRFNKRFGLIN